MKKIFVVLTAAIIAVSLCACGEDGDKKTTSSSESSTSVSAESTDDKSSASADESSTSVSAESTDNKTSASADASYLESVFEKVKSEAKLPEETADFSKNKMKRVFGLTDKDMTDFAGIVATNGVDQTEIVIVKAKDESTVEGIKTKLENERQSKYNVTKNYNPDQLPMIENAKVEDSGLYVWLTIAEDADKINVIFKDNCK